MEGLMATLSARLDPVVRYGAGVGMDGNGVPRGRNRSRSWGKVDSAKRRVVEVMVECRIKNYDLRMLRFDECIWSVLSCIIEFWN
jgi:hypothetical protein